ncbi:MAG: hypothetical protein HY040_29060 [Planctomycetes bacterium]|nr:hypothetical protein [Planctomycetota bacterium]
MRRFLFATIVLIGAGLLFGQRGLAQSKSGDVGPGDGGAVLRNPFDTTPANPKAPSFGGAAPFLDSMPKPGARTGNSALESLLKEAPDINQDLHVTSSQGPWMILIQNYRGPEAPQMASKMVTELRSSYRLNAFTFNFGAIERRKEAERVKAIIDKQKEYLQQNNLPLDQPIHVKHIRVEENVAVLVGGYASDTDAKRELDRIRKLPPPDPKKVDLDTKYFRAIENVKTDNAQIANPKTINEDRVLVNPFKIHACVVRNPTIKPIEAPARAANDALDMDLLKRLNSGEKYSLLACNKPYTLAIKQFQTPTMVESKDSPASILEKIGFKNKIRERIDYAATDAHNLADTLRKLKLEAFVLHTKYASVVTVGGYESLQDPNLLSMQNLLATRLQLPAVALLPRPMPMEVPRETKK